MDCVYNFSHLRDPFGQLSDSCKKNSPVLKNTPCGHLQLLATKSRSSDYDKIDAVLSLQKSAWYWGVISRQLVNTKLLGAPDGSFLVRNSSNVPGDYTLTVKLGGRNKLIKISQKSCGKYCLSEPFKFNSVVELINYYSTVPLSQCNSTLSIKLLYPITRSMSSREEINNIKREFVELNNLYDYKNKLYNDYKETAVNIFKEISDVQRAVAAYKKTSSLFKKQLEMHLEAQKCAEPSEMNLVRDNYKALEHRFTILKENKKSLENDVKLKKVNLKEIQNEIQNLEYELLNLVNKIDKNEAHLISRGERIQNIKLLKYGKMLPSDSDFPHNYEATWYIEDCSRKKAEEMLADSEDGTFLIRPSRDDQYALSIVYDGRVNHCRIFKTDRGYGFAEPFNIYKTLKELVLHYYYYSSLEEHNDKLCVNLAHPVLANQYGEHLETIDA